MPSTPQFVSLNTCQLAGLGVSIFYSTTSIEGAPRFEYDEGVRSVQRTGDVINVENTRIGSQVSIDFDAQPDEPLETVTLFVPEFRLMPGDRAGAALQTVALVTVDVSRAFTPPRTLGQMITYRSIALSGTARDLRY